MKCPTCVAEGERSMVYVGSGTSTLMGVAAYYDEQGERHYHDSNRLTTYYHCSRGHDWMETTGPSPCPHPTCDFGRSEAGTGETPTILP